MGRAFGGCCSAFISTTVSLSAGFGTPTHLGQLRRRREAYRQANGAGAVRRFSESNQSVVGYGVGFFFTHGSISWLYYSDRLAELPLGIFGIAIATVILPNLSAHRAAARETSFSATLDWALRWVLLIGVPSAVALILLAKPILITLFEYGALNARDVDMSALSLRAYSLGLIAFMLVKVLAPGFYARKDTATPVKIGIMCHGSEHGYEFVVHVATDVPLEHRACGACSGYQCRRHTECWDVAAGFAASWFLSIPARVDGLHAAPAVVHDVYGGCSAIDFAR